MAKRTTIMHDDLGLMTGPVANQLYSTLEEVLAAAGAGAQRVVVAGTLTAAASRDVPSNITLEFTGPGVLQVASGATVTILGHVFAPARQVFAGEGAVVFESDSCVIFPGWWGTGDGVKIGKLTSPQIAADQIVVGSLTADEQSVDNMTAGEITATTIRGTRMYEAGIRVGSDRVSRAGDVMEGALILARSPLQTEEATTKGYVDDRVSNLLIQAGYTPSFGYIVVDENFLIVAATPKDVLSLKPGFGMTLALGNDLNFTEDGEDPELYFEEDEADASYLSEGNGIVFASNEEAHTSTVAAADSIPSGYRTVRVSGDGAAVDLTSSPQVAAGQFDGQQLTIVGNDAINTVQLDDGDGLSLAGAASAILAAGDSILLRWDEADSIWREMLRAIA